MKLSNLFKRKEKSNVVVLDDVLYNSLFADNLDNFINLKDHKAISWIYESRTPTIDELESVANDNSVESRLKFLALYTALKQGLKIGKKTYFGTVLEVPMEGGYDVLAFYSDLRARYYNYSGTAVIYEGGRSNVDDTIARANSVAIQVCNVLEPWQKERLPKPKGDLIRISFLVSDGLYFGNASIKTIGNDQMASAIFGKGAEVMKALLNETNKPDQ
jgi:hypothetical protein